MSTTAPLQRFVITGYVTRHFQAAPDAPKQPGGSCWHCGTAIANCVQLQNVDTGEQVEVGTTCAERVGLDPAELKRYLAEKFAEERMARSQAAAERRQAEDEATDLAETLVHGEHGTESRYVAGDRCDACRAAAPHGTTHRFYDGGCRCLVCVEHMIEAERFEIRDDITVLVDIETGMLVEDARLVDTRHGLRWRSDERDVWLGFNPARRSTLANKGYLEAEVPMLTRPASRRSDRIWIEVCPMASPIVDSWGEPIARAV